MHRSCGISAPLTEEFPHHILWNAHGMMRTCARTISGGICAWYAAEMRMICCGNSFKEMTGREKLHFHLACSQDWVRDEGQASAPPPSTPPTKLGRPVWGPYNALDHIGLEGKRLHLQPCSPLGKRAGPNHHGQMAGAYWDYWSNLEFIYTQIDTS